MTFVILFFGWFCCSILAYQIGKEYAKGIDMNPIQFGSVYITPIETIDPPTDAMVRTFFCTICDNAHLQRGPIVRVWRDSVPGVEGYATNASPDCLKAIRPSEL